MKIVANILGILCCAILMAAFLDVAATSPVCAPIAITGVVIAAIAILVMVADVVNQKK